MDLAEMYRLINKKEKSMKDFIEFMDFMFENRSNLSGLDEKDIRNFEHHFGMIPTYNKELLANLRNDLINEVAIINIRTNKMIEMVSTLD